MSATPSLIVDFVPAQNFHYDGTFRVCPSQFKEVFIIHFEYEGHFFPVFLALKRGQNEEHYFSLFDAIIQELCPGFNGKVAHQDFQLASKNACETALTFAGCLFHFCQAIIKHIGLWNFWGDHFISKLYS